MLTLIYRKIDRIVLSKIYKSMEELTQYNQGLGLCYGLRQAGDLEYPHKYKSKPKHQTVFIKQYKDIKEKPCVYFKFGAAKYSPYVRIEFTPSKLDDQAWIDFVLLCVQVFGLNEKGKPAIVDFNIGLIELAADIHKLMSDYIYLLPSVDIENTHYLSKGTLYLGAEKSPRTVIIYDKVKKLSKSEIDLPHPLTRVEYRLKNIGRTLEELPDLPSPFNPLLIIPKARLSKLVTQHPQDKALQSFYQLVNEGHTGQQAYKVQASQQNKKHLVELLTPIRLKVGNNQESWKKWMMQQSKLLIQKFD